MEICADSISLVAALARTWVAPSATAEPCPPNKLEPALEGPAEEGPGTGNSGSTANIKDGNQNIGKRSILLAGRVAKGANAFGNAATCQMLAKHITMALGAYDTQTIKLNERNVSYFVRWSECCRQ